MTKTYIPHIRAVSDDKRPLMSEIEVIVASMKNLSGPVKRKLVAAFADAGLWNGNVVNAAALKTRGYYDLAAVDAALKSFPIMTRIEFKNALMRSGWLR
jgi:hypothetical protein